MVLLFMYFQMQALTGALKPPYCIIQFRSDKLRMNPEA